MQHPVPRNLRVPQNPLRQYRTFPCLPGTADFFSQQVHYGTMLRYDRTGHGTPGYRYRTWDCTLVGGLATQRGPRLLVPRLRGASPGRKGKKKN
eukprot:3941051-Rhodomonas_salina.5